MNFYKSAIVFILLLFIESINAGPIYINKAGYLIKSTKTVYSSSSSDSFFVKDFMSDKIVFRGKNVLWKSADPCTGLNIYKGNFSSFSQPGKYYILDAAGNKSSSFVIADTVFNSVLKKSLKGFYFQRCGTTLIQKHAGFYQHVVCHSADADFHSSTDTTGHVNATGGWHDAGDYGKYIVNAGISVGTLLMAYEMFPEKFSYDDLNIPESNNKIPDILDEARYELEWFLKMQRRNGAVFTKCTREQFEGFVMPMNDTGNRYVYKPSSTATGDFVAVMARAYRVFKKYDQVFAEKCLAAAKRGWNYLEANPNLFPAGGFTNPSGTATGEYGDNNDVDERMWASAELFASTNELAYHTFFKKNYRMRGVFIASMSWQNVACMALLTYLSCDISLVDQKVRDELIFGLTLLCDGYVGLKNSDGLNVAMLKSDYNWGSNSEVMNRAILLIAGYKYNGTSDYAETALNQLNYILGGNANDISFVTGIGDKHVMKPHHRPSASDPIAEPVPGLMAGGPNKNLSDDPVLKSKFTSSTPAALCYVDDQNSYASNEIAINWNAPLVFVAGYFNNGSTTVDIKNEYETMPHEFYLYQNYPNPFNPETTISYKIEATSNVTLKIFDMLGREVATLVDEIKQPGIYTSQFSLINMPAGRQGSQLSSGVYFYRLQAGSHSSTRKMILIK
jgi:endoglucanase